MGISSQTSERVEFHPGKTPIIHSFTKCINTISSFTKTVRETFYNDSYLNN